ncbi:hypothetical protein [Acinetobacter boissieri]|uniref:Uncharacterized protein n=1 Tax=Acinetobacter boissieri TaxID=1219383 RepID=A0A1G6KC70_9GAMM|nr:hypothetical protein [Acinetobacter boissieri]SDC28672.1 hypothetical protein SAMN05421733_1169 [Acinetobacter boissieri]
MSESFKYKRLEMGAVLFVSWNEYNSLLLRKRSSIESYSFCFYPFPNKTKFFQKQKQKQIFIDPLVEFCLYARNIYPWTNYRFNALERISDSKKIFINNLKCKVDNFFEDNSLFEGLELEQKIPFKSFRLTSYILPMLSLTSAVLEGTLREILAKYLQKEIDKYVSEGNKEGRYEHNNYQKILVAKQSFIESHSSINNLMAEYSILFGTKPAELIPKNLIKIIESMSTLRNFVTHGTSMVTTNIEVQENLYFKSWNKKVKDLQEILKKYFGSEDIFLNLSDYRLPEFYMTCSLRYLDYIVESIKNYDDSIIEALKNIKMLDEMTKYNYRSKYNFNPDFIEWFE